MTDDEISGIEGDIAEYGWSVMKVAADGSDPNFAYSIGMERTLGHPEIIIVGLPLDIAHRLINDVGEAVKNGKRYSAGAVSDEFLEGFDVTFRHVPEYQYRAYLGWGSRVYGGHGFRVLQMIYPDKQRRWPWQDGVSPGFRADQPVLADEPEPPWSRDQQQTDADG
jgi:hypothetical protein